MTIRHLFRSALVVSCLLAGIVQAEDQPGAKPIPQTRPEAKQALERLKTRTPRLPLPAPTEAEKAEAQARSQASGSSRGSGLGGGIVNNGRMRSLYLPAELRGGSGGGTGGRQRDPALSLDNRFGVELFWIASRVNNCHYCLGHQEQKLLSGGSNEDRIAALDCDWSKFTEAERAAFAFARKLTMRPDQITDEDLQAVGKFYEPKQVLEMIMLVSRYNATNRWTDSLGIPQEGHRDFLTATSAEFEKAPSIVAIKEVVDRGPLLNRQETLAKLAESRKRTVRLPLVDDKTARTVMGLGSEDQTMPNWMRLMANFAISGKSLVEGYETACTKGTLPAELKAQMAWVAARNDRAWYATDLAASRLKALKYTEDQIFALDQAAEKPQSGSDQVLAFTRKLTVAPQAIEDTDIANLRKHYSESQVAEIVYQITQTAMFNRLTEAAGLPLDPVK